MARHRILIALLAAALLAVPAAQAAGTSRLEFFIRGAWTPGVTGPAYSHSYDPHPGFDIPGSYARQTLRIDPLAGSGLQAGMTVFFGPTLGLRFSLGRVENPFGGVNSDFGMAYQYRVWMPAIGGFQYVDGTYSVDKVWPDTSGSLGRITTALEIVVRIPISAALSIDLTAGPLLSFYSGDIHSLCYTELTYERYGAFFFGDYFVRLRLPADTSLGFTGSAEFELRLDRHLAFVLNAGYRSGSYAGTPEIMAAYGYNDALEASAAAMTRIKAAIAPGPIKLAPSPFVFGAGMAVVF
jgi:hypothetical protein